MLKVFEEVQKNVKFAVKVAIIDNVVFRLHYRFTFAVLLVCTILVSSQQYIGEHIRCIADKGVNDKVIETFCFFTSTFTVARHLKASNTSGGLVPHPGVGPYIDNEPIIIHAYYQWVPFVLFGQALLFYMPHFIWKRLEGGRIKSMASGFERAALALSHKTITVKDKEKKDVSIPTVEQLEEKITSLQKIYLQRLHINRWWAVGLITCEVLNLLNLVLQMWMMDTFLGGRFFKFGDLVVGANPEDPVNPMDIVFPKVTKCTFYKYGASGSIQHHDALCVMALNIVNEKIYIFLWFWFIILFGFTALGLLYRFVSFCLHCRSMLFNRWVSSYTCNVKLNVMSIMTVTSECYFSDWLMLHYLALSMDGFVFRDLYNGLAMTIEENNKEKRGQKKRKDTDNGLTDEKEPLKSI